MPCLPELPKAAGWAVGLSLLLCPCGALGDGPDSRQLQSADECQARGDFVGARAAYEAVLARTPGDPHATERLGFIHFLHGEYPQAIERFREAAELQPEKRRLMRAYTAFAHYRLRHYAEAADIAEELGGLNLLNPDQLRLLAWETPYRIVGGAGDTAILRFLQVDPLPMVEIAVGARTLTVLIDTGGAQLVLDPESAREAGIRPISSRNVRGGGGGKAAAVSFGVAPSVSLGSATLANVPVWILPTRGYPLGPGRRADGILGTEVLMQFLPTLDYPGKRLILRPRGSAADARRAGATLPFVVEGIHYLYAACSLNGRTPVLMYFDSGLADDHGASMVLSGAALADLGVPRPALDQEGVGVGGASRYGYVEIDRVQVAGLEQRGLKATYRGGGGQLLKPAGYRSYGLISHHFLKRYRWTIDFDRRVFLFEE